MGLRTRCYSLCLGRKANSQLCLVVWLTKNSCAHGAMTASK